MTALPTPKLCHIGIYATDLSKMVDFYTRVFGLTVTDWGHSSRGLDIAFLSGNADEHHQLVIAGGRPKDAAFSTINQISFKVENLDDLKRWYEFLRKENVAKMEPRDHGNAWSVYFADPEGNRLEVYVSSPWYVEQPFGEPLDLTLPAAEILQAHRDDGEAGSELEADGRMVGGHPQEAGRGSAGLDLSVIPDAAQRRSGIDTPGGGYGFRVRGLCPRPGMTVPNEEAKNEQPHAYRCNPRPVASRIPSRRAGHPPDPHRDRVRARLRRRYRRARDRRAHEPDARPADRSGEPRRRRLEPRRGIRHARSKGWPPPCSWRPSPTPSTRRWGRCRSTSRTTLHPSTLVASSPQLLVAHPSLGVNSVPELIALAKAKPDTITYAMSGVGTLSNLSGLLLNNLAGIKLVPVGYAGSAQGVNDVIAGRVPLMFGSAANVLPHVQAGTLKALAATQVKRLADRARRADHDRSRTARLRRRGLDGPAGAGRHAARDGRRNCRKP